MNEQQLIDRLTRAADTLPAPPATSLAGIQSRAGSRRRRRHVLAVASVIPLLVVGVAVAQVLPIGPPRPTIEPLGDGGEEAGFVELADDAVWRSPEVPDVVDAVEAFADQTLGWSDVSVELSTEETGPVWVTITGPEQRTVDGLFTPTPHEGVWQLVQLGDGPGIQQLEPWTVALNPPSDHLASADLYVRYEGRTWHLPLSHDQLQHEEVRLADHGLPEGGQIDAVLIVYRDATGSPVHAVGGHYGTGPDDHDPGRFIEDSALTDQFITEFTACMAEHDILVDDVRARVSTERALTFRGYSATGALSEDDPGTDCENALMNQLDLHPYIGGP